MYKYTCLLTCLLTCPLWRPAMTADALSVCSSWLSCLYVVSRLRESSWKLWYVSPFHDPARFWISTWVLEKFWKFDVTVLESSWMCSISNLTNLQYALNVYSWRITECCLLRPRIIVNEMVYIGTQHCYCVFKVLCKSVCCRVTKTVCKNILRLLESSGV